VLAAGGAAVAFAFGTGVEKMHLGPPLVMIALGGMTLALAGAALWRVIDPLTRDADPAAAAPRRSGRAREIEREKQLVLKAIKEVELDYQMRKIAERDYRDMVERYRARALRLISELEAGDDYRSLIERELAIRLKLPTTAARASGDDKAPAAEPQTASVSSVPSFRCGACSTQNDDDAQFCKKCGAKL
jgi:hypothetical protein